MARPFFEHRNAQSHGPRVVGLVQQPIHKCFDESTEDGQRSIVPQNRGEGSQEFLTPNRKYCRPSGNFWRTCNMRGTLHLRLRCAHLSQARYKLRTCPCPPTVTFLVPKSGHSFHLQEGIGAASFSVHKTLNLDFPKSKSHE